MTKRAVSVVGVVVIFLSCFTSNTLAVDGWASMNGGTTGGGSLTPIDVSTATDFKTNVESTSPRVVRVVGTIDLGGGVSIRSNKTIMGLDTSSTIIGRLGFTTGSSNIIIQGLNITNPSYAEADGISVKATVTNLFITKCTVYDCGDGCIDISNASDYVTVSWCKFYYTDPGNSHRFVNLFSGSDTSTGDRGKLRITFHHNWWSTLCDQRMPRGRFGQVHVYNNYYSCTGNLYCIGVGVESQLRVESNYFDSVNEAWRSFNTSGYTPGIIGWNGDNQFVSTAIPTWATNNYATVFTPTYSYTLDAGANVKSLVMACAGNVTCGGNPPGAASSPVPSTGATDVSLTQDLSWTAGSGATSHDVYFGTVNPPPFIGNQAATTYDTGTMSTGTTYYWRIDEKNAGGTTTGTVWSFTTVPADTTPPTPNPMTFATAPYGASSTSVAMIATTASDISGVEYMFTCTAGGGHSSAWQDSTSYTDSGLMPSTTYTYTVQARDKSINQNANTASAPASAMTQADTTPPSPSPMSFATVPYAADSTSISMVATTATDITGVEYMFTCTAGGGHSSAWQDSTSYTDSDLMPSTTYTYTVKARDKSINQTETLPSDPASATTAADNGAPTPNPMTWAVEPNATGIDTITMTATTAVDISGVEYFFANITDPNHDSGWQDSTTYIDSGLVNNAGYTYAVIARDKSINHNETGWSGEASATTFRYDCLNPSVADLNANCQVDFLDYAILANAWAGGLPEVDLNADATLDWLDMLRFADDWLTCGRSPAGECWQ